MIRRVAPLAAALVLAAAPPVRAQDNPSVKAAVQLAAEGRGDSARSLVASVLAHSRPGDSTWVEALYWRARLASTGDSAEHDLRRVAIEYSSSKYADDALLQLSQLALAAGNPASALELSTRLRSDYPGSDLRARAALWAARAAFDVGEPRRACMYLDTAKTEAASDVEFVNQVHFYEARCTAAVLAAPPPDTAATPARTDSAAAPAPGAPASPAAAAAASRGFDVQVIAARSSREAQAMVRRLTRAHRASRVVAGADGLYRVRVGPFGSLQAADSAAKSLARIVGGSPFPVRAP